MSIYDFNVKAQDGHDVSLSDYEGKVLLIVNTATGCGFTPQYEELQTLYDECHDQGLEILDFPCNQFGEQAPGNDEEIHSFCTGRFGITFPQFSKIKVNGEYAIPLYKWLTANSNFKDREILSSFMNTIENPYHIPVAFKWMDAKEHELTCPVVVGTDQYVGAKIKCVPNASVAFGYSFEMMVLKAQSMGIGTVWIGGTMNRQAFEKAMNLGEDEIMPCVSPLGYPAGKMSVRESMMRKGVKADERLPFEELFFDGTFEIPLTQETAGIFAEPLEAVRLAPSAVNKQPWRVVISDNAAHFYLKRSKGFGHDARLDMQKIDIGIALCHFALTAEDNGLNLCFMQDDPMLKPDCDAEYIATYTSF